MSGDNVVQPLAQGKVSYEVKLGYAGLSQED